MVDLVYICSPSRSGSTLLNQMIGTHPDALPVGEMSRLPKNIAMNTECSCGETVRNCSLWSPVVERLSSESGHDLWDDPYSLDLGFIRTVSDVDRKRQTRFYLLRRAAYMGWLEFLNNAGIDTTKSLLAPHFRHWLNDNLRVHRALREQSGRKVIVDSSKSFRIASGLCKIRPDNSRIILLSRDGRGVIASYLRDGATLKESVHNWKIYYERALKWLDRNVKPDQVLHVKYENLVENPTSELARIFQFLQLPPIQGFAESRRGEAHILAGNRGTLRSSGLSRDERWRAELTREQVAYFMKSNGSLMRKFGYDVSES